MRASKPQLSDKPQLGTIPSQIVSNFRTDKKSPLNFRTGRKTIEWNLVETKKVLGNSWEELVEAIVEGIRRDCGSNWDETVCYGIGHGEKI